VGRVVLSVAEVRLVHFSHTVEEERGMGTTGEWNGGRRRPVEIDSGGGGGGKHNGGLDG
jgi:hypothetical protein